MARRRRSRRAIAGRLLAVLVLGMGLLLAIGVAALAFLDMPTYELPAVELEFRATPAKVARGRQLVSSLCASCHFDGRTGRLSGRELSELESRLGTMRAPNLTRDPAVGIGDWSPGELALLLRTGLHPRTAQLVPPPAMPRWPRMSDDDLTSIIAFLGSEDPWVEPHDREPEPSTWTLRAKARAWLDWSPLAYPNKPVVAPSPESLEAYGAYLVDDVLQCQRCHGETWGEPPPSLRKGSPGYLMGGAATTDANGKALFATNLTPHATGLGGMTSEDLRRVLVDGFGPDGAVVRWPTHLQPALTQHEVEAIHAHLQTVPPVANAVEQAATYKIIGRKADAGRHLYLTYGCHLCHGERGVGFADLRGAATRFGDDAKLIAHLRAPQQHDPLTLMPSYGGVIAEADYPELAAYIRRLGSTDDAL